MRHSILKSMHSANKIKINILNKYPRERQREMFFFLYEELQRKLFLITIFFS
jgi:hypothetical protein